MWDDHEKRVGHQHVLLSCMPKGSSDLADIIRRRGGIPVLIGDETVVELSADDVAQNWYFAQALPPKRVTDLTHRLGHELDCASDIDGESPSNLAGEAAAFLFLALRHTRSDLDRALDGCRILWNGPSTHEQVEYLA